MKNKWLSLINLETKAYAHQWFFLAACGYAILIMPLTMLARHGYGPAILAVPANHAFEMLFGFALALIAGYLLGPMPRRQLALFLFFWLLARLTGLTNMATWLVLASNAVFAVLLAQQLLPRLWVAKKWRNRILAPLLGLICILSIAVSLISQSGHHELTRYLLGESVQLFALLMLFMGGRMLAPAIAGEFYRQGMELQARVQPRVEAGLIVTIIAAVILAPVSTSVSGILLITSGMLAAIRLFRWQLWHCLARPDLICLSIGYAWLAMGLIMLGSAKLDEHIHLGTAIHAITVGALGTLACNVLVRVSLLHTRQYPSHIAHILVITVCMTVAAMLRISADFSVYREILLAASAIVWSISFFVVLVILFSCLVREPIRKTAVDTSLLSMKTSKHNALR
ncbi:NnrS family protein [Nitrosomonas aestuarii]|uniref:NnrS family protein n=1 Tax=Nitrosomonas aestuarii TaxID=52441 RepID=UPI000D4997DF|nr:NnrS family protein [Nitrosomonas aestuarii]PTN12137.1 uncharacterized protein involved in response to NO [Nitrosomonas aestuarii]